METLLWLLPSKVMSNTRAISKLTKDNDDSGSELSLEDASMSARAVDPKACPVSLCHIHVCE